MANTKVVRFDWALKHLLRDKSNFDILEGFLSALLEDDEIKVLQILESEANQEDESDKFNRIDILIEDGNKHKIIIEIQNTRESHYLERLLFGTSKVIVDNIGLGQTFQEVVKVISVSVLYFNLGSGDDYLYYGTTEFRGLNTGNPLIVKEKVEKTEDFEIKYKFTEKKVFPEYYLIKVDKYPNVVKKKIDEWIYWFKNNQVLEGSTSKNIDKVREKLARMNMTEEQRKAHERYVTNAVIETDMFETAREDGKLEVARNLASLGVAMNIIFQATGLTQEEIENL
ncbi:MAG: PD-(D/E)XK nuclease family transposase [Arcicella sp.]|nr:PD-(D/E)XK nuclease family transposase [Arcicella sp.]